MVRLLNTTLPVFLVIGAGLALRAARVLKREDAGLLTGLGYYVGLPAVLFHSIAVMPLGGSDVVLGTVAVFAAYAATLGLSLTVAKLMALPRGKAVSLVLLASNGNHAYVGLPIVDFAFGPEALAMGSYLTGILGVWFSSLNAITGQIFRAPGDLNGKKAAGVLRELAGNQLIIAVALGLAFNLSGLKLPVPVEGALVLVKQLAAPVGLLSVGASLDLRSAGRQLKLISAISAIKLVFTAAVAYAVFKVIGVEGTTAKAGTMLLSCPSSVSSYFIVQRLGGDEKLAANSIAATTALSLLSMTLVLGLIS